MSERDADEGGVEQGVRGARDGRVGEERVHERQDRSLREHRQAAGERRDVLRRVQPLQRLLEPTRVAAVPTAECRDLRRQATAVPFGPHLQHGERDERRTDGERDEDDRECGRGGPATGASPSVRTVSRSAPACSRLPTTGRVVTSMTIRSVEGYAVT